MRFRTSHGMIVIALVALGLAIVGDRSLTIALLAPLAGGLFVVAPVLGLSEWFAGRDETDTGLSLPQTLAVVLFGLGGVVLASIAAVFIGVWY